MADAFQCDRCRGYEPAIVIKHRVPHPTTHGTTIDLCPACWKSYQAWVDLPLPGAVVDQGQEAYASAQHHHSKKDLE